MRYVKKSLSSAICCALLPAGLALTASGTVFAQDQEAEDSLLEEVVVTARKVEESIQEVPVAVTAIGTSLIEDLNINDLSDIG